MNISVKQGSLAEAACDALIVNLFEGVKAPGGGTGAVDTALGGQIARQIEEEEFEGKLGKCMLVRPTKEFPAKKVIVVGLGKAEKFDAAKISIAAANAIRKCQGIKARKVATILHGAGIAGLPVFECAKATALGALLGSYEFTRYKTNDEKKVEIDGVEIVELSAEKIPDIKKGIERAQLVADAVAFTRDMVNEPSNVITPSYLAEVAQVIAKENNLKCRVMERDEFTEMGMGMFAAVAKGASAEPKFISLGYEHPEAKKTIALVGKGITYDTGGYSLKGSDSMYRMKDDMSGAGAVLAAMRAIDKIKPKVNVLMLVAATENAIGPNATHPGDVVTSLDGKTVEINNTDAEGRLTLGDAVTYAKREGADEIIDLATLTGACVTALGTEISGIVSNNQQLVDALIASGKSCSELIWQLPMHENYKEDLKSDIADMKNTSNGGAGAIKGALFIQAFADDTPWAHIDMSSTFTEKDLPLARKGALGFGAGTLVEYLLRYA